jgi:hypothetical protein
MTSKDYKLLADMLARLYMMYPNNSILDDVVILLTALLQEDSSKFSKDKFTQHIAKRIHEKRDMYQYELKFK